MCEYCKNLTMVTNEETIVSVGKSGIDFGIFGKGEIAFEIDNFDGENTMSACLNIPDADEYNVVSVKIRFCPFCGRKLAEES